jgi:hypothetical protein
MNFIRAQWKDFLQFYFVPFCAALMPWRLAWRWIRWWTRKEGSLFEESAAPAVAVAPKYLPIPDVAKFAADARAIRVVDCCDLFLSRLHRNRAWRPWHVRREGEWPVSGPFIAVSFHHGTGHWVFKTLAEAGHDSTLIAARWSREEHSRYPLRYRYGRLRGADTARLSGMPVAYRPGVAEQLARVLSAGNVVVGVIDMPPRLAPRGQHRVRVLDCDISLPDGTIKLAQKFGIPLVPYWTEIDLENGTRVFRIGTPIDPTDESAALRTLAGLLDQQIRGCPPSWHFWSELPQWIVDASAIRAAPGQAL